MAVMAEMIIRYFHCAERCSLDEDLLRLPFVGPEKGQVLPPATHKHRSRGRGQWRYSQIYLVAPIAPLASANFS